MCLDLSFASFGCSTSTTASVTSAATLSAISTVLSANSSTVGQAFTDSQVFTVDLTGAIITAGSTVNITQTLNANVKFVSSANTQVTSQIINSLQAMATSAVTNMSTTETELLAPALNGSTVSDVLSTLNQALQSSQTISAISSVMANYDISQTLTVPMAGATISGSTVNITQDSIITLQASAMAGAIANVLASNTELASISTTLANTSSAKSTGLAGVISAIGGIFTGPFKWIAIIVVICIIGLGMLLALKFVTKHHAAAAAQPYSILQAARAT